MSPKTYAHVHSFDGDELFFRENERLEDGVGVGRDLDELVDRGPAADAAHALGRHGGHARQVHLQRGRQLVLGELVQLVQEGRVLAAAVGRGAAAAALVAAAAAAVVLDPAGHAVVLQGQDQGQVAVDDDRLLALDADGTYHAHHLVLGIGRSNVDEAGHSYFCFLPPEDSLVT